MKFLNFLNAYELEAMNVMLGYDLTDTNDI